LSEFNLSIGSLEHLESPFGNAGGVVKRLEDVERMAKTGVGWIEAGSYTLEQRLGNEYDTNGDLIIDEKTGNAILVYYHDPETGQTFNSLGMPNKGIDKVYKEIPEMSQIAHAHNKALVVNVAPVSAAPADETRTLVALAFEAGADEVIVNGGCPNVVLEDGTRKEILSTNPEALRKVLCGLKPVVERFKPVWLRISSQYNYDSAKKVFRVIESSGMVSTVLDPNTFPGKGPLDNDGQPILGVANNIVGKSGPATSGDSLKQVKMARDILNGSKIDLVASGGIMDNENIGVIAAEQMKRCMDLGAVGVAGTTFFYENPDWREATHKLLSDFAELS
jgi:dihydroorotate dehydrogenase